MTSKVLLRLKSLDAREQEHRKGESDDAEWRKRRLSSREAAAGRMERLVLKLGAGQGLPPLTRLDWSRFGSRGSRFDPCQPEGNVH